MVIPDHGVPLGAYHRHAHGNRTSIHPTRRPSLQPNCSQGDEQGWTQWTASHTTLALHQQDVTPADAIDSAPPASGSGSCACAVSTFTLPQPSVRSDPASTARRAWCRARAVFHRWCRPRTSCTGYVHHPSAVPPISPLNDVALWFKFLGRAGVRVRRCARVGGAA
jgi:hypothetical protein